MLSQFAAEEEVLFPPCTMLIISPSDYELRETACGETASPPFHASKRAPNLPSPLGGKFRLDGNDEDSGSNYDSADDAAFQVHERHEKGRSFIEVTAQPCFI